ncbi:hypothetical protein AB0K14_30670 [Actinosynnema sp. NPDC050801]|uniref:hypothetical protein n=1 Tax=Actinosynnema sp. NPDC050801 TaxID=3155663 RepID=UPI00341D32B5
MPIVVALLAGIFGIVGVVLGQLINARRERAREDVRWARDREREERQRIHDKEMERRAETVRAVAQYVGRVRLWEGVMQEIVQAIDYDRPQLTNEMRQSVIEAQQAAAEALGVLELVSGGELQHTAMNAWYEIAMVAHDLCTPEERGWDFLHDRVWSVVDEMSWVLIEAKKELGFDEYRGSSWSTPAKPSTRQDVSPSPPSAQTP